MKSRWIGSTIAAGMNVSLGYARNAERLMTSARKDISAFCYAEMKERYHTMRACLLIGLGGFVGAVFRYLLSMVPASEKMGFPVMTLFINIAGALLIGILAGLTVKYPSLDTEWMAFLRIGICGGFTTFSTFALEATALLGAERMGAGILYIGLSLALGLGAVWIGRAAVL